MKRNDVIEVLKRIARNDRRPAGGEPELEAYTALFDRNPWITPQLAFEAVDRHFAASTEWFKPAHLVQQAKAAKTLLEADAARATAQAHHGPAPSRSGPSWRQRNPQQWETLYRDGFIGNAADSARRRARLEGEHPETFGRAAEAWAIDQLGRPKGRRDAAMPWPPPGARAEGPPVG